MKMRRIFTVGFVALITVGAALRLFSRNSAKMALEMTQRALRHDALDSGIMVMLPDSGCLQTLKGGRNV
jgi:hypothetical protein